MDYKKYVGSKASFPSRMWGELKVESASFSAAIDGDLVVYIGEETTANKPPLVRIHSECVFAEVFDSEFCDCSDQMYLAMNRIKEEGFGIFIYLRIDGRGAGLAAKVKATALEMDGMDTHESRIAIGVAPEGRSFEDIGKYLLSKGYNQVRLLSNNPEKINGLESAGVRVAVEKLRVSEPNEYIKKLYKTKDEKFSHLNDE